MINGGASFRWSFDPLSAWDSTESTTILNTHHSLEQILFEMGFESISEKVPVG